MSLSIGQLRILVSEKKEENDKDIRSILNDLKELGYTKERAELLLMKSKEYEKKQGGNQGNRNVITAVELYLSNN